MASLPKLTYFDMDAGGEVVRLAFAFAGAEYVDNRIPFSEWPKLKPTEPWFSLPTLEIDGHLIGQSGAILRLVGKRHNLYPNDEFEAALVDEVLEAAEDVFGKIFWEKPATRPVSVFHL